MIMNVADALSAYRQSGGSAAVSDASSAATPSGSSFSDTLKGFAQDTVGALKDGEKAAVESATGQGRDLTSIVTAISKAELMLQTVVTIRDKVIAAYQDISKTSI